MSAPLEEYSVASVIRRVTRDWKVGAIDLGFPRAGKELEKILGSVES